MRPALLAVSLLVAAAGSIGAQAPADFSGQWVLEPPPVTSTPAVPGTPATASPGDMGSGWGTPLTITQDAARLRVEYLVFSRYDLQPPVAFVYPLDGSIGRNAVTMGRGEQVESTRAAWSGNVLVLTTTSEVSDPAAGRPFTSQVTRRLSLDGATTLRVEVERAGVLGGPATTTRALYRKE